MPEPDPELLSIQRPRCPKCQMRMISVSIDGVENRAREYLRCCFVDTKLVATDPIKADASG